MKKVNDVYPVGADEEVAEKTFLSLNFLTGNISDSLTMLGLEILNHALFVTPAAPLKKVLIDSKLGKDIDSDIEEDLLQPAFNITLNGSESDKAEKFYNLLMDEMNNLVEKGIDKTLLQASINLMEFRLREADFGLAPKGLIYGLRILRTWLYGDNPNIYLRYESDLQTIKDNLNNKFFENLLQKYFIDNPHKVLLILSPDKNLAKQRDNSVSEKLAEIKSKLSDSEIAKIIETTKQLKIRQQTPDTLEALNTIPMIQLSDIKKEPEKLPLKFRDIDGTRILHSAVETNGIIYLIMYFDAGKVPQKKLFHAYLLNELLGRIDTKKHSYQDLANLINLNIGGFGTNLSADYKNGEPDSFAPRFRVFAKALNSKVDNMSDILSEIFTETIFIDKKRLREIIEEEIISVELALQNNAVSIVTTRIASYQSNFGAYNDAAILPFYQFLKSLLADFDKNFDSLVDDLIDVYERLINRNGLIVSVTANDSLYKTFLNPLTKLIKSLPTDEFPVQNYDFNCTPKNEGLYSQSRVQYVAKGGNFINSGYKYHGVLNVLETILRYEYFWLKVRVQGGAYGAFCSFGRNGNVIFSSYRDPNLKETLDIFDSTADFIKNFQADESQFLKLIIGTFSRIDKPLTPSLKGQLAADFFLKNISYEDRLISRQQILSADIQTVQSFANLVDDVMKKNLICVFGNEEVIKNNSDIFKSVKQATE